MILGCFQIWWCRWYQHTAKREKKSNLLMYDERTMPIKRSQNVTINQSDFHNFKIWKNFIRQVTKACPLSQIDKNMKMKAIIINVNWIIFRFKKKIYLRERDFLVPKRFFFSISCYIEKCCVTILIFPEHNNTNRVAFCTFKRKTLGNKCSQVHVDGCMCTPGEVLKM